MISKYDSSAIKEIRALTGAVALGRITWVVQGKHKALYDGRKQGSTRKKKKQNKKPPQGQHPPSVEEVHLGVKARTT